MGLKAGVSLKWTALQEWLVQVYACEKLDCYYMYDQLTQIQQVKLESVAIYQLRFEEKLWATMPDTPATFQVSHFMNGLIPELHKRVRGAMYPDLTAAVKAAAKEEAK